MADYTTVVRKNLHRFKQVEPFLPLNNPSFHNPAFEDAPYHLLIVRLSPFGDVDRSIPHLFLFQEVRRALPGAYVDMAFFPTAVERELFTAEGIPYLLGAQSCRSVDEFDLVLISNSYTLELINLPYVLIHSGIPLFSSQRGPEWPIMVLGGSNAAATQAIVRADGDSLVDGIFFGEGEGMVGELAAFLLRAVGEKRDSLHEATRRFAGFWAAGTLGPTIQTATCTPEGRFLPVTYPLLNGSEAQTANLQITYGCPAFCAFCFEGYDRKPYRELPVTDLLSTARQLKRAQGNEELGLYSFNANTHRDILSLLLELHRLFDRVSLKSQRVDILQHAGYLLEAEVQADKRSFTLGIEGISERQRAWLHKSLPTQDIVGLLRRLFALHVREIKLFYLLTGHETDEDIAEFRQFLRQLKELHRAQDRAPRLIFSFGLLIRMPFTPLQFDRLFLDEDAWRALIGPAKSACETNGFEFRLAFDRQVYCVSQVLALGGYWLVDAVVALAGKGYCFEDTLPSGYWDELQQLDEGKHLDPGFLGAKGPDYPFALDFVRSGISREFLYRQYLEAESGQDRGYCLGTQDQTGTCLGCGACVSKEQREAIVGHTIHLPEAGRYVYALQELMLRKRRLRPVYLRVRLPRSLAGASPAYLSAFTFRAILALYPELVGNVLAVRESLFTLRPNDERYPPMTGETVMAVKAWDVEQARSLLSTPCEDAEVGLQIVGLAEGFIPGTFTRVHLDLDLPAEVFPQPRQTLDRYLQDSYLPYSLRREDSEGKRYRFQVPSKGTKKKILFDGFFEVTEERFHASLEVGPKFDLMALLELFGRRNLFRHARAHVFDVRW